MSYRVRVWDLPTRLFHWLLAASVLGLVATGKAGGAWMQWHGRLGLTVLALLLFRLAWGFVGGRWSRFASFLYRPRSLLGYLQGQAHPDHLVGHTPLGAASVFAMLAVLAAQVGTGLLGDDEIGFIGPLNRFVSTDFGLAATAWHKQWGQWLVIGLVLLHVAAVLFYLLARRDNLIRPMVSGDKELPAPAAASRDGWGMRLLALALLGLAGGAAAWVAMLGKT